MKSAHHRTQEYTWLHIAEATARGITSDWPTTIREAKDLYVTIDSTGDLFGWHLNPLAAKREADYANRG